MRTENSLGMLVSAGVTGAWGVRSGLDFVARFLLGIKEPLCAKMTETKRTDALWRNYRMPNELLLPCLGCKKLINSTAEPCPQGVTGNPPGLGGEWGRMVTAEEVAVGVERGL